MNWIELNYFQFVPTLEHRSSVKHFVSLQFLNLGHSVGLLGRVISPSQGRYLTQTQNKHTAPASERAKTVHVLDISATVIGSGCIGPYYFDLGTSWRWMVSFAPLPLYLRGKSPRYPLDRRLGGPQSQPGRRPYRDSKSDPSVIHPVGSPYTDYATLAPLDSLVEANNVLTVLFNCYSGVWSPIGSTRHCGQQ
jgi:hypothetical protein